MSKFVAAAVQMVSGADIDENLANALDWIRRAAIEHNAQLIVLPENFLCMKTSKQRYLAEKLSVPGNSYLDSLQKISSELGVCLIAGSMPFPETISGDPLSKKVAPISLSFTPSGTRYKYQKIHLFDVDVDDDQGSYRESDDFVAGQDLMVFPWQDMEVGLSICYDLRFPELYGELVEKGAQLIAVPAAFTETTGEAHWEVLLRARAIECQSYVIAANQGGEHSATRSTWGQSMIVDPWGRILDQIEKGPGLAVAEVNGDYVATLRNKMPLALHRR